MDPVGLIVDAILDWTPDPHTLALRWAYMLGGDVGIGTLLFAFGIGPLGHFFLLRLHLGVDGGDPDPDATIGE